MAFPYSGYARLDFTGEEQEIIVGQREGKPFIAEETVLFATQDCWVAFKEDERDTPHWIPAGVYWEWYRRCPKIWVKSDGTNGHIHMWNEGHTRQ